MFFVPAITHIAVKLLSCCNSIAFCNGLCGCCVYADDNFLLVTSATLVATNYLTIVTTKVRSLSYQQSLPHQGTWWLEMGRQWWDWSSFLVIQVKLAVVPFMTGECAIDRNVLMPIYKIGWSMSKKVICYFCKRRVTYYIMWKELFVNIITVRKYLWQ